MIDVLRFRVYAIAKAISAPFDAGKSVEVKFEVEPGQAWRGALYAIVPAASLEDYLAGEVVSFRLVPVE